MNRRIFSPNGQPPAGSRFLLEGYFRSIYGCRVLGLGIEIIITLNSEQMTKRLYRTEVQGSDYVDGTRVSGLLRGGNSNSDRAISVLAAH